MVLIDLAGLKESVSTSTFIICPICHSVNNERWYIFVNRVDTAAIVLRFLVNRFPIACQQLAPLTTLLLRYFLIPCSSYVYAICNEYNIELSAPCFQGGSYRFFAWSVFILPMCQNRHTSSVSEDGQYILYVRGTAGIQFSNYDIVILEID